MLYDLETLFSNNQEVTTTATSDNVVCLAKGVIKEVSFGTPLPLRIQVTKDFDGATGLTIEVETASDKEFSDVKVLATTGKVAIASLVAGYVAPINFIPKGNLGYMRLKYTVEGTATAGAITAGIVAADGGSYHEA